MKPSKFTLMATLVLGGFTAQVAHSKIITWDGGYTTTAIWNNANNWVDNASFANGDDVFFGSVSGNGFLNTYIGSDKSVHSITFQSGALAFNIRLASTNSGGTSRNLSFNGTNTGITVEAGDNSSHIIGLSDGTVSLSGDLPVTHNGSGTLTIDRPITGATFGLTKSGTGTMVISAVNTYDGATTISGGKLLGDVAGDSASSAVTLDNTTATFGVSVSDNTQDWTCASLETTATGTLEFNFGATSPSTTVSPLNVTNAATFTAQPVVSVVVDSGLAAGTYPLITWGSTSGTAPTSVTVASLTPGTEPSLSVVDNTLNLVITEIPPKTWTGAGGNLSWNNANNWDPAVAPVSGDDLAFGSAGTVGNTFLASGKVIHSLKFTGDALAYDVRLATGGQSTDTAIDLTFNSTNTGITVQSGNANNHIIGASGTAASFGNVILAGDLTIDHQGSGTLTLNQPIKETSVGSSVTKTGSGTVVLSGDNSTLAYTGTTNVNGGTLLLANTAAKGSGDVVVGASGTIGIGVGPAGYYSAADLDSLFDLTLAGFTLDDASGVAVDTTAGDILLNTTQPLTKANRSLTKLGTGTLTLQGNNTYTGATNISEGSLVIGNNSGTAGKLAPASTINIAAGGNLTFRIGNVTKVQGTDFSNAPITGGGSFSKGGTAGTVVFNQENEYTGQTNINSGTLRLDVSNALSDSSVMNIGPATLDTADGISDTINSVFLSGAATINLGTGATLAFADSSALGWGANTLNITGDFQPGVSLRFGTTSGGLTPAQLALITVNGSGTYTLDGSGYLISAAAPGFAAWQTANSTAGGLDQDHDGDGVSNGVEYFIYGPVANSGFTALPGVTNTAGTLSVTWTHAAGYTGTYGSTGFVVETSDTLASWITATESGTPATADTVYINGDNVTYTFPAGTKNFARLKVTGP